MKFSLFPAAACTFATSLLLFPTVGAAQRSPAQSDMSILATHAREIPARGPKIASWMKQGVVPSKTAPFVYVSLITGLSSGQTNIYQPHDYTLKLVGQMSEGGGPLAVDGHGNLWVSGTGTDVTKFVARPVYVYAPGSTKPSRVLHP